MSKPLCACHGEPQRWSRDARYGAGGFWRCRVKDSLWHRADYHDDKSRDRVLRKLMRQQVAYHQRRVRELAKEEGCPSTV